MQVIFALQQSLRRRFRATLGALALFWALLAPAQAANLEPITSVYKATLEKGVPFNGKATRSLKPRPDGTWEYRFLVESMVADIDEVLILRWENDRVVPLSYDYQLRGWAVKNRHIRHTFDWTRQQVTAEVKDRKSTLDIPPGTLDKLGFQLQLMQDLKAGKQRMEYTIVDKDRLREYVFEVLRKEKLDTEQGQVETVVVERVRAPEKKRETHMWFVPDWNHLLVRLVQIEEDGTRYEIHMDRAEFPNRIID